MQEIANLKLIKDGLDLYLELKIKPEIEKFFSDLAIVEFGDDPLNSMQVSSRWLNEEGIGLPFYKTNTSLNNSLQTYMQRHKIANDFGNDLLMIIGSVYPTYENIEKINIAPLRIVGASQGIKMKTNGFLTVLDAELYLDKFSSVITDFYNNYLDNQTFNANINFELL